MSTLEADSIMLSYGAKKVLQDVYVKLETGKVVGILGRNGTGKSSLLKILFGTLRAESASVRVDNHRGVISYMKKGLMAFLPQDDFVPGAVRVRTALNLFGISLADIVKDFPAFEKLLNQKIKHLSGGERRLLETYIVLKSKKEFILLDEPFSYLMPLSVEKLKEIIKSEKANKCIVITDHMYKDVEQVCDILYLMRNGKTYKVENKNQLIELGYLSHE